MGGPRGYPESMRGRRRGGPGVALLGVLLTLAGSPLAAQTTALRRPTAEELAQGWWMVDGTLEVIGPDSAPRDPEPGFGGLEQGDPPPPAAAPEDDCTREALVAAGQDGDFRSDQFVQGASRYFFLRAAPTPSGWAAIARVQGVIDAVWDEISLRFGSSYVVQLKGFVYSTDRHYHEQSGGMAWSGGFYDPRSDETHLPAPPCTREDERKALLIHELTHYRLRLLTDGKIQGFLFFNEGLAQVMEEPHSEGWRDKLEALQQIVGKGYALMPYASMTRSVGRNVGFFYAQSWATAHYLEAQYGHMAVDALLQRIKAGDGLDAAFQAALSRTPEQVRQELTAWIRTQ